MAPSGAYRHAHVAQGPFFQPKDAMRHNRDISGTWTTFVLDKSEGFTQVVWSVFMTRSAHMFGLSWERKPNILKNGTGFDAQKQFLADIENAIASPVDILSSISRYQKTLQYASTPPGLHVWDWTLSVAERHCTPSGQYPGVQQRDPDSGIGRGYRTQPWDKLGKADRLYG